MFYSPPTWRLCPHCHAHLDGPGCSSAFRLKTEAVEGNGHLRGMSFMNQKNPAVDPQLWKTLKEWRKKGRQTEGWKKRKEGAKREQGGKRGRENIQPLGYLCISRLLCTIWVPCRRLMDKME